MAATAAPAFLQLAGHPLRWRLLSELAWSDRHVRELTDIVGKPQSLVSYHLARLRAARLVSMRKSSADRRDSYYSVDLPGCAEALSRSGAALHPGLDLALAPLSLPSSGRVLFLCTGNSSRSQMAEALLRRLSGGSVDVTSAGSHPRPLHPFAATVMSERGVDFSTHHPKHLDQFASQPFDFVITLCDRVREVCPEFPGNARAIHWSIPDPSAAPCATLDDFRRAASDIEQRIRFLLPLIQAEIHHPKETQAT